MHTRRFGASAAQVAAVGQGTWQVQDPERAGAALRRGLDLGLTHIDTAELYGGAEELLAPVIRDRRDDVFLVSKVLPSNGSRAGVRAACERSLTKLGVDHLDAYLLHWPSDEYPLAETMGALGELVDEGKVRFLGVSNFEAEELDEAARHTGGHPIVCNQVLYHLGDRGIETGLLEHCAARDVAVVAYSPFGTGAFPPESRDGAARLADIARAHGASAHRVALAFLLRHPNVLVIPKSESTAHVADNGLAADLVLDDAEIAALDAAFPVPSWS